MRAAFYTLGCKLNQSESEALASTFGSRGFFVVPHTEDADIYIFNTCTVTSMAEQKARRMIRKTAREHPEALIVVTGCYAELEEAEAAKLADNVAVVGQRSKDRLLDLPDHITELAAERLASGAASSLRRLTGEAQGELTSSAAQRSSSPAGPTASPAQRSSSPAGPTASPAQRTPSPAARADQPATPAQFRFAPETYSFHSRAFLKIQDGCDRRCGYCRVPLARGPSVSLGRDEVAERALRLSEAGYREIVLTGVNISSYRDAELRLPGLIRLLTRRAPGARLRLSSIEPEAVDEELLDAAAHPRVCPHFHLPVQSGSDSVLSSVGRPYGRDQVRRAVERLRSVKDDPFIAADLITGLPGEGPQQFDQSYRLAKECCFSHLHVFPYSPRPGTRLYDIAGPKVPERTARERARLLTELSDELAGEYLRRQAGREAAAILEQRGEDGRWTGLTESYLHITISGVPASSRERTESALRGSLCGVELGAEGSERAARFTEFIRSV